MNEKKHMLSRFVIPQAIFKKSKYRNDFNENPTLRRAGFFFYDPRETDRKEMWIFCGLELKKKYFGYKEGELLANTKFSLYNVGFCVKIEEEICRNLDLLA